MLLRERGADAFAAWVRRTDDARLDAVLARGPALRVLFGEMSRRYEPDAAQGFEGDLLYDLRTRDGAERPWTLTVDGDRATAHPGSTDHPAVRVRATVADFARIAAGELDAGEALLDGRLDVHGDVAVAARLGEMFGQAGLLG